MKITITQIVIEEDCQPTGCSPRNDQPIDLIQQILLESKFVKQLEVPYDGTHVA